MTRRGEPHSPAQVRKDRAATRRLRDLRRTQGLCIHCGDLLDRERAHCSECARVAALKARAR